MKNNPIRHSTICHVHRQEQKHISQGNYLRVLTTVLVWLNLRYKALDKSFSINFSLFQLKRKKEVTKQVAQGKKNHKKCKNIVSNSPIQVKNWYWKPQSLYFFVLIFIFVLTVFLSIPRNKLPWSKQLLLTT